jgi:hypothetical protein
MIIWIITKSGVTLEFFTVIFWSVSRETGGEMGPETLKLGLAVLGAHSGCTESSTPFLNTRR